MMLDLCSDYFIVKSIKLDYRYYDASSFRPEKLLKSGLTMNIGTGATPSKTKAMHFPPPRRLYSHADISRLDALYYPGNPVGFIDFTTEIKYLASIEHHSLTSDVDADKRIMPASAALGLLTIFSLTKTWISKFKEAPV
jgi:hypothetical protein